MTVKLNIFAVLLLAPALSLSSCVNEVKNPAQAQDTLSQLKIVYNIPDSNEVLAVHFHAVMTPPWQKNYRLDWTFGDSTGIISKFDTSNLTHYYQKFGSYVVTLSIFDTASKTLLGKTSVLLDLEDNAIDTNFLHGFTKVRVTFFAVFNYGNLSNLDTNDYFLDLNKYAPIQDTILNIHWLGRSYFSNTSVSRSDSTGPYSGSNISIETSLIGSISYSGNKIDTENFLYSMIERGRDRAGFSGSNKNSILRFASIPIQKKDLTSMSYSNSGPQLQTMITQFNDTCSFFYPYQQQQTVILQEVLWNVQPTPTLTVTFYK